MNDKGVMFLMREPEKYIAVVTGNIFKGITAKKKEKTWLLVIKLQEPSGKNIVGFVETHDWYTCWEYLYEHLKSTSAPIRWREDRY